MDARPVLAWSGACLVLLLATGNPGYRALVVLAAAGVVAAGAHRRAGRAFAAAAVAGLAAVVFNFVLVHTGADVLFQLPDWVPALGGPYTVEAIGSGVSTGLVLAGALLAVAPLSLLLEPAQVVESLPPVLARTGAAAAAALNLAPALARSFRSVAEAQRLRGWRPHGPASWAEVAVPMVLTAIEDSIQLAEAMEARAFGSGPRTHLRPPALGAEGWAVVGLALAAVLAFTVSRALGWAADWYPYPVWQLPMLSPLPALACSALALPAWPWRSHVWTD
jgi:energy-coupling factor transport system permease protein